jgi:hypothetical protein
VFTRSTDALISFLISLAAWALRCASCPHFSRHHGKAAPLFASPGRFNGGIQSKDVRLECDTFDNVDDIRDFAGTVGNRLHGVDDAIDHFSAARSSTRTGGQLSAKPNIPRGAVFQFSLFSRADNPLGRTGADPEAPPTR